MQGETELCQNTFRRERTLALKYHGAVTARDTSTFTVTVMTILVAELSYYFYTPIDFRCHYLSTVLQDVSCTALVKKEQVIGAERVNLLLGLLVLYLFRYDTEMD